MRGGPETVLLMGTPVDRVEARLDDGRLLQAGCRRSLRREVHDLELGMLLEVGLRRDLI